MFSSAKPHGLPPPPDRLATFVSISINKTTQLNLSGARRTTETIAGSRSHPAPGRKIV